MPEGLTQTLPGPHPALHLAGLGGCPCRSSQLVSAAPPRVIPQAHLPEQVLAGTTPAPAMLTATSRESCRCSAASLLRRAFPGPLGSHQTLGCHASLYTRPRRPRVMWTPCFPVKRGPPCRPPTVPTDRAGRDHLALTPTFPLPPVGLLREAFV